MFPWRMETRLRDEDPSGVKAPVGVSGRWPTNQRHHHACHRDSLRREPLDIFHGLGGHRFNVESTNQSELQYVIQVYVQATYIAHDTYILSIHVYSVQSIVRFNPFATDFVVFEHLKV